MVNFVNKLNESNIESSASALRICMANVACEVLFLSRSFNKPVLHTLLIFCLVCVAAAESIKPSIWYANSLSVFSINLHLWCLGFLSRALCFSLSLCFLAPWLWSATGPCNLFVAAFVLILKASVDLLVCLVLQSRILTQLIYNALYYCWLIES